MATEIAIVMAVKNQRCQPPAPARKLNAAPALCIRTRLKNGVTSSTSPGAKAPLTQALVARSAMTIARLTTSHRIQRARPTSGMLARLSRPFEVRHAPRADRCVLRVRADVTAVMPAALALGVCARLHRDLDRFSRGIVHGGARGDEDEAQVGPKRSQELGVGFPGAHFHFGLERRADLARGALLFQPAHDFGADLAQPPPPLEKRRFAFLRRQDFVP